MENSLQVGSPPPAAQKRYEAYDETHKTAATTATVVVMAKCPSVKTRIKNALEGARAGGLEVGRVIVRPDGEVVIVAGKPGDANSGNAPPDETAEDLRQLI